MISSAQPRLVEGASGEFYADPVAFLLRRHREYGDMFAVELDGVPTAIFGGQFGAAVLFRAERDHLAVYNTPLVHELFGRAIFNLSGGPHRQAQQLLRSAVTGKSLRVMTPAIKELAESHVERWSEIGPFEIYEAAREFTLEVCSSLILGLPPCGGDAQYFPDLFSAFVDATDVDSRTRVESPIYRRGWAAANELRDMVARQVVALSGAPGPNMLSNFVANGYTTLLDVGDHMLAAMIAARETTASLLTWLLIELAQSATAANAIANEICVAEGAVPPTLRSMLWETERRHSPNVLSRRKVLVELATPYGVIPQGWCAAYSPSVNHLQADLSDDPESFIGNRFNDVRSATGLLTFGRGVHACPGKQFAELLAVTLAKAVLGAHRISLAGPAPSMVRYLPVKAPACPVQVVLHRREIT